MTVLILLLVAQLTYLQVVDADNLAHDTRNVRSQLKDFNRPRGKILTADGQIVAQSVPSTKDPDYKYLRQYPQAGLFAHVAGYQSFINLVGSSGVEESYNDVLTGQDNTLRLDNLGNALSGKADTNDVVLSLTESAQQTAVDALHGQRGSVVALDVQTGAIVAMYSNPTFDPNALSVHSTQFVQGAFNQINSGDKAALQRAYRELYPPGSTFKVVTSKSAIELGQATPDSPSFAFTDSFQIPGVTDPLFNFGHEVCGGTLEESLIVSCNATFAKLGYDMGDAFAPAMDECGIDSTPPIDLDPPAVESLGPRVGAEKPRFALAGIGQGDVFTSPLQMALIAEGIANGGVIKEPHVVKEVHNSTGKVVKTIQPKDWMTCMQPTTAAALKNMMVDVVNNGTGINASLADQGIEVAGKTGTAETADNELPHAWFIAFAPASAPRYAVAVIIEHGGSSQSETTGGEVAAPIAKQMLQNLLANNP
ncbi:MAG TPA: penicillin-binding transpeptidase domain-containing protein [Acidimicrobiia bacterium]